MARSGASDQTGKPQKTRAQRRAIRAWQEDLPAEQAVCRDLQHAWIYQSAEREDTGFVRQLGCLNCGAFKLQHLDHSGYILRTSYEYPEGYVRPAGAGRLTQEENAQMRLQNLRNQAGGGHKRRGTK